MIRSQDRYVLTKLSVIFILHLKYINQNSRASENKLLLSSCIIRKDNMVRITLSAAFILKSGPEISHLCIFLSIIALERLVGNWVPYNVWNT